VTPPDLQAALTARLSEGGRCFVPYVTGGLVGVDAGLLRGLAACGADALEVGLPFSDPVIDGPVIQEASRRALESGTSWRDVLDLVKSADLDIPVVVMTYLNPVLAAGLRDFPAMAAEAGVAGVIVPDLPVDEAGEWLEACREAKVAPVFLAAPGASSERLHLIGRRSGGFVYCVSTYGVTGERRALSDVARPLVEALRPHTSLPLLVGVGIGTPEQAKEACAFADGVVVGSALVRPLLEGRADRALDLARRFREAATGTGPSHTNTSHRSSK
jgi:tryptophan synthase alpha chain